MYNLILFIFILSQIVIFCLMARTNMHAYQLNHYKINSQFNWIIRNKKKMSINTIFCLIIFTLLFLGMVGEIVSLVISFLLISINLPKKAKISFKYTNRIRLQIVTTILLVMLIIISAKLIFVNNIVLIFPLLNVLTPLFVIVSDIINKPINKLINKRYINEAKAIIDSMPNLIVIGVTGSYGKTSVKNFLYKILSSKYNVLITPGNYNTTLGVVKTIRENLKATHEVFICEMGACNVGDIKEICDIVKPKYGIITSIGQQHLESFKTIDNIISTKFELIDSLPKDGIAFLNYDNNYIANKKIEKTKVSYGIGNNTNQDFSAYDIKMSEKGLTFKVNDENNNPIEFFSKLIGKHNVVNIVGSIAVANTLGVSMNTIVQKVRQLESVPHRQQLISRGDSLIIDDAYNSNPLGAESALNTLSLFEGVKILVTPGMIELGDKQFEYNYNFGIQASKVCDYIVLVGKEQTKPIYEGILSTNYKSDKLIVVDDLQSGINKVDSIQTKGLKKIVLFENDLPDNY